ncbi:hypothetical protein ABK040_005321 [Willaertia magna]
MPKSKDGINYYQIAIIGDGAVGKSSITIQYTSNTFQGDIYDPTIEDSFYVKRQYNNIPVQLEIVDTAGQEDYKAIAINYMQSCYGFILVFDLTRPKESLQNLIPTVQKLRSLKNYKKQVNDNPFPCVLLGNKHDLTQDKSISEQYVQKFMTEELELNCPFFFTSAKTRFNIEESFEKMVEVLREFESQQPNAEWKLPSLNNETNKNSEKKKKKRGLFSSFSDVDDADLYFDMDNN